MKYTKYVLWVITTLLVIILVVQNDEAMSTGVNFRVSFFSNSYTSPMMTLYHVVPIAFLFGFLVGTVFGVKERFQLKKQINTLVSNSQERDKELNSLRNLPITIDDVSSGDPNST